MTTRIPRKSAHEVAESIIEETDGVLPSDPVDLIMIGVNAGLHADAVYIQHLEAENAQLRKMAYLTIPIPRFLQRKPKVRS
jgi:hypothetical protein